MAHKTVTNAVSQVTTFEPFAPLAIGLAVIVGTTKMAFQAFVLKMAQFKAIIRP